MPNDNHDEQGRFASGDGGGGSGRVVFNVNPATGTTADQRAIAAREMFGKPAPSAAKAGVANHATKVGSSLIRRQLMESRARVAVEGRGAKPLPGGGRFTFYPLSGSLKR